MKHEQNDVKKDQPRKLRDLDVQVHVVTEPVPQEVLVAYPTLCGGTNTCYATPELQA